MRGCAIKQERCQRNKPAWPGSNKHDTGCILGIKAGGVGDIFLGGQGAHPGYSRHCAEMQPCSAIRQRPSQIPTCAEPRRVSKTIHHPFPSRGAASTSVTARDPAARFQLTREGAATRGLMSAKLPCQTGPVASSWDPGSARRVFVCWSRAAMPVSGWR